MTNKYYFHFDDKVHLGAGQYTAKLNILKDGKVERSYRGGEANDLYMTIRESVSRSVMELTGEACRGRDKYKAKADMFDELVGITDKWSGQGEGLALHTELAGYMRAYKKKQAKEIK